MRYFSKSCQFGITVFFLIYPPLFPHIFRLSNFSMICCVNWWAAMMKTRCPTYDELIFYWIFGYWGKMRNHSTKPCSESHTQSMTAYMTVSLWLFGRFNSTMKMNVISSSNMCLKVKSRTRCYDKMKSPSGFNAQVPVLKWLNIVSRLTGMMYKLNTSRPS